MIAASSTVLGRPLRGSSSRAASPWAANRSRHLITVGRLTPIWRAVSDVPAPPATVRMIRARSAWPAVAVVDLVHEISVARSASLRARGEDGMRPSSHLMSMN